MHKKQEHLIEAVEADDFDPHSVLSMQGHPVEVVTQDDALILPRPLRLVIFDCDGVLVDSETVANRVVAEEITKLGWPMTTAESQAMFMGMTLMDMLPVIRARITTDVSDDWPAELAQAIMRAFNDGVLPMPGSKDVLKAVTALGLPWRVASNSSRAEMEVKFAQTGLDQIISFDRVHSAGDVIAKGGRGKPAPDVFLAAAEAEGIDPAHCLVIEDSETGVRAAMAAGMACLGYAPHGGGARLRALGAMVVRDYARLPALLKAAMGAHSPKMAWV